jgi:hypothetical protein
LFHFCSNIAQFANSTAIFSAQKLCGGPPESGVCSQIQKACQQITTGLGGGMVLAIPLTQAAVGPFRKRQRLRQGEDT